jgi:hypothetical protein
MKGDQVKKNNGEQVISITTQTFPWFQKNSTTQIIKYKFIWCIIYEQSVPNMGVGKSRKENIKVLLEYELFEIISKKNDHFSNMTLVQEHLKDPKKCVFFLISSKYLSML